MKLCKFLGCTTKHYGLGFCLKHYTRFKNHGDPSITTRRANGEGCLSRGYWLVSVDGKLRMQHIVIAETAFGKPLPPEAVVHHGNGIKSDNRNDNLVICPDEKYHQLLHQRMRSLAACGHADWRKCNFCKEYDAPENMKIYSNGAVHPACHNAYYRKFYVKKEKR